MEKQLDRNQWIKIGAVTAVASVVAVLITQAIAIAIWPDIALFKPLDSYARTAVFTIIPVIVATALLAWLVGHKPHPVQTFIKIAVVVLLLSFIPDYILPVPDKTFLASSVAAFMHVVAAIVTVSVLVTGYRRQAEQS
jgi:hypothetical protein